MSLRQNFSIPEQSIIYYIARNPASPTVYQKLTKCCKYFYSKNPIVLFHCLYHFNNCIYICPKIGEKSCIEMNGKICEHRFQLGMELYKLTQTIWVTNFVRITEKNFTFPPNFRSFAVSVEAPCGEMSVDLMLQFGSSIKSFNNDFATVMKNDGTKASFSEIIQCFPNIEEFIFWDNHASLHITSTTVKELLSETPNFFNLKKFELHNVSELFDFETFYQQFLRINKTMDVCLYFNHLITDTYKQRLEVVVSKMLQSNLNEFWPPVISAPLNQLQLTLSSAHEEYRKKFFKG